MNVKYQQVLEKKKSGIPISVVTAYDYPTAQLEAEAGIDLVLVGDSVGTNVLGYSSEKEVTMYDMVHHLKAVVRGAPQTCIIVDLPYGAASDATDALKNSRELVSKGADIVKIEGWSERSTTVRALTEHGIPVCGHIGYNPQIHGQHARVFGKDADSARILIESALKLEHAGAVLIVVEKVPEEVCRIITERLSIPVIGIGSGKYCDGQVLVFHDIVGLTDRMFKHVKRYAEARELIKEVLETYRAEVEQGIFPEVKHAAHVGNEIISSIGQLINEKSHSGSMSQ